MRIKLHGGTTEKKTHHPGLRWHVPRAHAQTYITRSSGLSSSGHQSWAQSCIGWEQFLHVDRSVGGWWAVKRTWCDARHVRRGGDSGRGIAHWLTTEAGVSGVAEVGVVIHGAIGQAELNGGLDARLELVFRIGVFVRAGHL